MSVSQLQTILRLIPAARRRELSGLVVLMLGGAATDLLAIAAMAVFLAVLLGQGAETLPNVMQPIAEMPIGAVAILFAAVVLTAGAVRLALSWFTQSFATGAGHDIACEVQRRLLLQPYAYHLQQHSSTSIAALQKVEELVWGVLLPVTEGAVALVIATGIILALLWIDPITSGAAIVGLLLIYGGVLIATRPALRSHSTVLNQGWNERVRLIGDSLGGIRDIIIDGSQPLFNELFRKSDLKLARARVKVGFLSSAPRFVVEAIGLALIALATALLASRSGNLTAALPLLGALALAAQRLLPLLQQLYRAWAALTSRRDIVAEIGQLVTLPVPIQEDDNSSPLRFERELGISEVAFAYEGQRKAVLHDVSMTIPKGSRVALIGRTGSGKSTLADIIMGLLQPSAGQLLVDGFPVLPQDAEAWRRNVAHVPQIIFLVDDTLEANIAFGVAPDRVDQARARSAATLAQLDDLIEELPAGLATHVGERGVRLSGGQRQRLGLARAIYRGAPLLVLDEATNALDSGTELAVLRSLDAIQDSGTTIIIIAHRSSALVGSDRVYEVSRGRLELVNATKPINA